MKYRIRFIYKTIIKNQKKSTIKFANKKDEQKL